jgi:hypothetical protein
VGGEERLNDIADKIATLLGEYEAEQKARVEWRKSIEDRLRPVEEFVRKLDTPVKVMGWAFALVAASILTAVGAGLWKWFNTHFNG